ncbi:MAG: exosortase/archaeosortase family protein [Candidatus Marsarchaeota archaeon]|nr:exosortase/archaeosortase family protein [Candidatus Marsarchaeota archaeon]
MFYDKRKGIVIFTILVTVALLNSFFITPLTISDSDFSTYIIVPLMLLPLLALFTLKERIIPDVRKRDLLTGAAVFALLVLITIYLRVNLSYLFTSLHIDMLLFPMMIAALAIPLFGVRNISRFKVLSVYALFASPVVLLWLSSVNSGFVIGNTLVIYGIVGHIFHNVGYTAPITITANSYSVGIGSTCVGIGVLVGIVMFLVPVAYLYDGRLSRKALWVASGFALVLGLNILRMLGIAIAWFAYGPSNAILTIHLFAGVLLFYLSIIIMLLLSGRFGLRFPAEGKGGKARIRMGGVYKAGIALAIAFTIIYFMLSSDYPSVSIISPLVLYNQVGFNASNINPVSGAAVNQSGLGEVAIQNNEENNLYIELTNSTFNASAPIAMLVMPKSSGETAALLRNSTLLGSMTFLGNAGNVQTVYMVASAGRSLLLYAETIPYVFPNGTSTVASIYAVLPANRTSSGIRCYQSYDVPYTALINALNPDAYNATANSRIIGAYCIVRRLVSR